MSLFASENFTRDAWSSLCHFVASMAAFRAPGASVMMTSDLAWQLPGSDPKRNLRLWYRGGALVGYVWFQPPGSFVFDVDPRVESAAALRQEVLHWALQCREEYPPADMPHLHYQDMTEWANGILHPVPSEPTTRLLSVPVLDSDVESAAQLRALGFAPSGHYEPHLVTTLPTTPAPESNASNMTVRAISEHELDAFLACHRAAWAPSTGSSVAHFAAVRSLDEVFDPSLQLVAVDSDGQFAACTIFWVDPVSGIGSLEPFGTHPDYRGRGVSQLLIWTGLSRLAEKGMTHCRVYTAGFNHQAQSLYRSSGFIEVDRSQTFVCTI